MPRGTPSTTNEYSAARPHKLNRLCQGHRKVAEFYKRTLALLVPEEGPDFVVVGDVDIEISVVKIPEAVAQSIHIATPPVVREQMQIKCSYLVEDLHHVRAEAAATGGGIKSIAEACHWRGQLHLDGYDPEGNVVQFRKRDA